MSETSKGAKSDPQEMAPKIETAARAMLEAVRANSQYDSLVAPYKVSLIYALVIEPGEGNFQFEAHEAPDGWQPKAGKPKLQQLRLNARRYVVRGFKLVEAWSFQSDPDGPYRKEATPPVSEPVTWETAGLLFLALSVVPDLFK